MPVKKTKTIIVTRSVSGSGKSTLAALLCSRIGWVSVEADSYFYKDGVYKFDAAKLGAAHEDCRKRFTEFLFESAVETIVVANTSTTEKEIEFYRQSSEAAGATFISLVLEKRHGGENQHNVPLATLARQEANLRNSLKLS